MRQFGCLIEFLAALVCSYGAGDGAGSPLQTGTFNWNSSSPLMDAGPDKQATDPLLAIKDPTIVHHDGRWHMFATIRAKSGKVDIQYLNFTNWTEEQKAPRHVLALHNQYY